MESLLDVNSACLMHLNREYVYDGACHDEAKLFTILDLTTDVTTLEENVKRMLSAERDILRDPVPPDILAGPQCGAPYSCEFVSFCTQPAAEHHISTLPNLSAKKAVLLVEARVSLIIEIPPDFALSELQQRICAWVKTGDPWFSEQCTTELSYLEYPLYSMDFESVFPAIPRYRGMGPYAHIPLEWSVHRKEAPHARAEHFEFLAEDGNDPQCDFFESLSGVVGNKVHVIAYNARFEPSASMIWLAGFRNTERELKKSKAAFGTFCRSLDVTYTIRISAARFRSSRYFPPSCPN